MNLKRRKWLFRLLAVFFTAGGVAAVYLAYAWPYVQPNTMQVKTKQIQRDTEQRRRRAVELQQFAGLWDKNLRPPLIDDPTTMDENIPTQTPTANRPDIKLIGYAIEVNHSLAMLKTPDDSIAFVGVGEELHGVTVHAISSEGVMLVFNGEKYLLPIDEEAAAAAATQNIRRADRRRERPVRY